MLIHFKYFLSILGQMLRIRKLPFLHGVYNLAKNLRMVNENILLFPLLPLLFLQVDSINHSVEKSQLPSLIWRIIYPGVSNPLVSGPHWKKKSCLGPPIKYIVTCNHKKNLVMFWGNLRFCVGPHSQPSWVTCGLWAPGWTPLIIPHKWKKNVVGIYCMPRTFST